MSTHIGKRVRGIEPRQRPSMSVPLPTIMLTCRGIDNRRGCGQVWKVARDEIEVRGTVGSNEFIEYTSLWFTCPECSARSSVESSWFNRYL